MTTAPPPPPESSLAAADRWKTFLFACGVAISLFQLWSIVFSDMDPLLQRGVFLTSLLAFAFFGYRPYRTGFAELPRLIEKIEGLLSAAVGAYFAVNFERILGHWPMIDPLSRADFLFGIALFLLVLDLTRRVIGWPIVVIALAFALYVLAGHRLSGSFSHRSFSLAEFMDQMVYTINGIFGTPLAVAATYVYVFILFGVVLYHSGAGEFFIGLARAMAGGARGGAAKVAVLSCGLFGMISGSPTSDAVTTGAFTIPLMKRMGYPAAQAGAIVAVAATGGGIMPPVMGSAAFIMAEFTGIPYIRIAIASALPALLYYLCVLAQVHFLAIRQNLQPLLDDKPVPWKTLVKQNFGFFVPIFVLVFLLLRGNTPTQAAFVATALTLVTSWFRRETRMTLRKIAGALEETARAAIVVAAATASAGILVGAIAMTGVGGKFTALLFQASGESLFPVLLITMVVCIILGMGMPVPSAYILTAVVAAPALIRLGVPALPAHLFILYFAVMSAITPPVAVAAFAAAGIAGANPNEIGWRAVRLGIVAFIVPFMFVYQPELLLRGGAVDTILALVTSVAGVIALAGGLEGWLLRQTPFWQRVLLVAGGLGLLMPGLPTDLAGLVLTGAVVALQWRDRKAPSFA